MQQPMYPGQYAQHQPVMNPSAPHMQAHPGHHMQQQHPGQAPHQPSYPVMNAELREQIATGANVFPSPPGGRASMPGMDAAAELASPVGQHYGENVDWAAAAAAPAKAIPPWKLVLFFVGALGLALLITILLAKAIR
jgi:hypothetical protein